MIDLTNADVGRRIVVRDGDGVYPTRYFCTIEERVGGGYVFIWDVTNLPIGIEEGDTFEWLD